MAKDYYSILGVSKDADEDAVKKAYKKAALKWHPDRNKSNPDQAHRKFQEVGEAFEVLSDKNKRAVYDQFGEEGLKGAPPPSGGADGGAGMGGFPGFGGMGSMPSGGGRTFTFTSGGGGPGGGFRPSDPNDIFANIFGAMGGGGGGFGGMGGMPGMGGRGGMGGMDVDDDFGGFGGGGGARRAGGARAGFRGMPGGFSMGGDAEPEEATQEVTKTLPVSLEDLYKGTTKKLKIGRRLASGGTEEKVLQIDVKPGWKKGTKVRFAGSGNETAPGKAQDVVFVIDEKPHSKFVRDGDDLVLALSLPLVDALDPPKPGTPGGKKNITTLDGRTIDVPLPGPGPGKTTITPGRTTRLANEGMPISKTKGVRKGDLVVKWEIAFPERLSDSQRADVRRALS